MSTPGAARKPAAPTRARKATAATIQAGCRGRRCGIRGFRPPVSLTWEERSFEASASLTSGLLMWPFLVLVESQLRVQCQLRVECHLGEEARVRVSAGVRPGTADRPAPSTPGAQC